MKNKIIVVMFLVLLVACTKNKDAQVEIKKVYPTIGDVLDSVSTNGEIKPQNRVEIIPPMAGRIEKIFVKEGEKVTKGDILMEMSSTERAALLDNGGANRKYWEGLYKPTPIIASINGEVIARDVEPGQTVTGSTILLVLSNRLIIKANVDETDIGRVKVGQKAIITLDAYPDVKVFAKVDHIAFESTVVNNVTIYEVEIVPEKIPAVFRSGMSTNIDIIVEDKKNVMLIPLEAIFEENNKKFVLLESGSKSEVKTGLTSGENIEIISGISDKDCIVIKTEKLDLKGKKEKSNPFMPKMNKKK